jgi:hypothetical protein
MARDYFLGPVFAATKHAGRREITIGDRLYIVGGFHPLRADFCPPALDVRHARAIFTLLSFREPYSDNSREIRFAFNDFCRRYANSQGGRYMRAIKEIVGELMDSYIQVTDLKPVPTNICRMIDNIREEERKSLQNLMNEADLFVKHSMNERQYITPMLLVHGKNGIKRLGFDGEMSEQKKDQFALVARLTCIAEQADATVFVSEAWVKSAKPGEKLDLSKQPSEYPDRQEAVIMIGQTRTDCQQRSLPMLRAKNGKFIGFGEQKEAKADQLKGRFANLIPDEYPNELVSEAAKAVLDRVGLWVGMQQTRTRRKDRGMQQET